MTIDNSIQVFQGERVEVPTRANRRLSKRLVPVSRKPESKEVVENEQLESTCTSLRQQLKERTDQLQLAREGLTKGNLEFQEFADAVSHDLQTPLRAISGFSQFLQEEYQGQLDEIADGYLDQVVDGASRMEQLIKGLVQFSRVTSKAMPFELVSLNEVFEEALIGLHQRIESAGAVVRVDDLPVISGDRAQLTLLFQNLIENGLIFNKSQPPSIRVQAEKQATHWAITVSDNGIGIAKKHLDCVFAIFRRLHAKGQYEGVGVGLAVCRRIAERHLGQFWLSSEEGVGTAASIRLPAP